MKISVLGAGGWGSALAYVLNDNGHSVILWDRNPERAEQLSLTRINARYLPDIYLNKSIYITSNLNNALLSDIIVLSVPSQAVAQTAEKMAQAGVHGKLIINTAKGFSMPDYRFLSDVIKSALPDCETAVLSGPSHAEETARKIPTSVVAAAHGKRLIERVQDIFMNDYFRVYGSADVKGVEIGGAVKNVIALAAGMVDGLGFGDNTKAALMTRGFAEIKRLGVALGARADTFYGLTGMGDLIVTCTSMNSRNRRAGILLGQGLALDEVLQRIGMTVEGVTAAAATRALAQKADISMPITESVDAILFHGANPREEVTALMTRRRKINE